MREEGYERQPRRHDQDSYRRLGIELTIDFDVRYLVMYTMIATISALCLNVNRVYVTLMMVAPMGLVMLVAMRSVTKDGSGHRHRGCRHLRGSFFGMRPQAGVGDAEFLRSTIPMTPGRSYLTVGGTSSRAWSL